MGRKSTAVEANLSLIKGLLKQEFGTIKASAEHLKGNYWHLSKVLSGERSMSAGYLKRIASLLDKTMEELAIGTGQRLLNYLNHAGTFLTLTNPQAIVSELAPKDLKELFDLFVRFGIVEEVHPHEININVNVAEAKDADLLDVGDGPDCEVE